MNNLNILEQQEEINLYRPVAELLLRSNEGSGKYVTKIQSTGTYITNPEGFLPGDLDTFDFDTGTNDDPKITRTIVTGMEEDIASKVSSSIPLITTPLGIMYPDDSVCSAFVFRDAVVEYRENIGVVSSKPSQIPGKVRSYMESYASVGFPIKHFNWIKESLNELHGIELSDDPKSVGIEHNGRLWFTANISNVKPIANIVRPNGTECKCTLISIMQMCKRSVKGNVCVSLSLKRIMVNNKVVRGFSIGLKHMQIKDVTDDRSPGLANAIDFKPDLNGIASSAVMNILNIAEHDNKTIGGNGVKANSLPMLVTQISSST